MKRFLSLLSTICILFACTSQETDVDSAQSQIHYDLGIELAKFSLYQNSLEEFALAMKLDPSNVKAYRKKGLVHFGLKHYDKAEALFKKTIALDPENVQAHINLGMVKYSLGDKMKQNIYGNGLLILKQMIITVRQ